MNDNIQTYTITDDENIIYDAFVRSGIRTDLNLNITIPEEELTICINNYIKYYDVIENILFYYKNESAFDNIKTSHQEKNINIQKKEDFDIHNDDKLILNRDEKYTTMKKVLAGMGINLISETKKVKKGKKYINETCYTIQPKREIYEIVYCLINKNKCLYDDKFVAESQCFNKYEKYLISNA